jgi:hypothetical protein
VQTRFQGARHQHIDNRKGAIPGFPGGWARRPATRGTANPVHAAQLPIQEVQQQRGRRRGRATESCKAHGDGLPRGELPNQPVGGGKAQIRMMTETGEQSQVPGRPRVQLAIPRGGPQQGRDVLVTPRLREFVTSMS